MTPDHVSDIHAPGPRKGILGKAKDLITPQPKTDAEARERYMIKKWKLKKDPRIPHRYWVDDRQFVTFISGDEESISKAEQALEGYFRAPTIEKAPGCVAATSPYTQSGKDSSVKGVLGQVESALQDLEPLGRKVDKISTEMTSTRDVFDPGRAQDELMSTRGIPKIGSVDYTPPAAGSDKRRKKKRSSLLRDDDDFGMSELREPKSEDFMK